MTKRRYHLPILAAVIGLVTWPAVAAVAVATITRSP